MHVQQEQAAHKQPCLPLSCCLQAILNRLHPRQAETSFLQICDVDGRDDLRVGGGNRMEPQSYSLGGS